MNPRDASLDNPASSREDDQFNRWPFSKRLADTIATFDAHAGAPVFGVFGKWGYGKSSVLNFVMDVLQREYPKKIAVYEFNPWLFRDQEMLIRAFFAGLAAKVEQRLESRTANAGQFLAKYGGALSAVPFIGSGLGKATEQIGKDLSADSLQDQRARLAEIMGDVSQNVVVVIDDLDRLDRDEIMAVLKLVRLSANFPHIIYLLAFDDEMVARAVGEKYGGGIESGSQFLEKIIQYPFTLPAIRQDRLVQFVLSGAKEVCTNIDISLTDKEWETLRNLTTELLSTRLGTPRQAIRFMNALRFSLPMLKGEVDPLNQILVEGIRILFPELYALGREKQHLLLDLQVSDKADEFKTTMQEAMRGASANQVEVAVKLMKFLVAPKRGSASVFDPRYFDRYFSYSVGADDIADSVIRRLLTLADDAHWEEFAAELQRLATTNAPRLFDGLLVLAASLEPPQAANLRRGLLGLTSQLQPPQIELLHKTLLALVLKLEPSQAARVLAREGTEFLSDKRELARQIVKSVTEILHKSEGEDVAVEVVTQAEPLPLALLVVEQLGDYVHRLRDRISRRDYEGAAKYPFQNLTPNIYRAIARRISESAESHPPYLVFAPSDALQMLQIWHVREPEKQMQWLKERLQNKPEEADSFLEIFSGSEQDYQKIQELIDPKFLSGILTEQSRSIPPGRSTDWFLSRQKLAAQA
jgi:hypothetical protein